MVISTNVKHRPHARPNRGPVEEPQAPRERNNRNNNYKNPGTYHSRAAKAAGANILFELIANIPVVTVVSPDSSYIQVISELIGQFHYPAPTQMHERISKGNVEELMRSNHREADKGGKVLKRHAITDGRQSTKVDHGHSKIKITSLDTTNQLIQLPSQWHWSYHPTNAEFVEFRNMGLRVNDKIIGDRICKVVEQLRNEGFQYDLKKFIEHLKNAIEANLEVDSRARVQAAEKRKNQGTKNYTR